MAEEQTKIVLGMDIKQFENGITQVQNGINQLGGPINALNKNSSKLGDTIGTKFKGISSSLAGTSVVLAGVGGALTALGPLGDQLNFEGIGALGEILGGMSGTIASVSEGIGSLGSALGVLIGPVGAIVLAIAVLGLALYDLWNNNETFKNGVLEAWSSIQTSIQTAIAELTALWVQWGPMIMAVIGPVWEGIKTVISTAVLVIMGIISLLLNAMTGNWEGVKTSVIGIVQALHDGITGIIQALVDFFTGIWTLISTAALTTWNGIATAAQTAWNLILTGTQTMWNTLVTFLTATWTNIITWANTKWTAFKDSFLGIWNAISVGLKGYVNGIIGMINKIIKGLNSIQVEIPDWIPEIGGNTFGINLPYVPYLANGGIVTRATLAVIGEAGPEAVIPLDNMSSGLGGTVVFNISGPDPEEVVNLIQRKLLRVGVAF
ncbi:MAG: hypothetical protein VB084_06410 [Syntrophomonadaceae bacterium]|nr:hypothetical protein [Syntrophomonadaceae bacterium]